MFLELLESAPDSIVIADRKGRIVLVNHQTEKLFGYNRNELLGESVEILMPPRFRERHVGHRADFMSQPGTRPMGVSLDLLGKRKDGSEFPVEISLSQMKKGRGLLVTSVIRDITGRKRVEDEIRGLNRNLERRVLERTAQLERERDRAQKFLDVAGAIILVLEPDQTVKLINKMGCEILGVPEKEIVGENWIDKFVPERMRDGIRSVFKKVMSGNLRSVEYYEHPVVTQTGEEKVILWHNILLRNEHGEVNSCISSGLDITEKLQLEQQIRQTEKLAAVGQLVSGLAHEIGTPLGVIGGRAEYMLRKMSPEDPIRENLKRIITQIDRITKIVNQLLSFTRRKPPEVRSVRLVPILQEILSLFEHQTDKQGISAKLESSPTLPEVKADPDQIQQVFFNIILNAIHAMPQGGNLDIHLKQTITRSDREDPIQDQFIKIQITDTGFGIPSENLTRIFDPFFTTKDVGKGTGLGLATSLSVIKNHGGWIDVRSRLGDGSIFCIYIPLDSTKGELSRG